jgi:hypothetical protein
VILVFLHFGGKWAIFNARRLRSFAILNKLAIANKIIKCSLF